MKKLFLALALFLFSSGRIKANSDSTSHHLAKEVTIGYGIFPTYEISDGFYGSGYIDKYNTGAFSTTIKYYFDEKSSLAFAFSFESEKGQWGYRAGEFKRRCFTLGSEFSKTYASSPNGLINVYYTLGLAMTYRNEVDTYDSSYYYQLRNYTNGINEYGDDPQRLNNRLHLNVYISPLGIKFGRRAGVFAEVGIGYKGLGHSGLFYKF